MPYSLPDPSAKVMKKQFCLFSSIAQKKYNVKINVKIKAHIKKRTDFFRAL